MKSQIEFEQTQPSGYLGILRTPTYRKRAFLSCFVQFAANNTGALVINYYSVIIYGNLGLSGEISLLMYCIYTLIGALGNLFSLLTVDKTGRRFVRECRRMGNPGSADTVPRLSSLVSPGASWPSLSRLPCWLNLWLYQSRTLPAVSEATCCMFRSTGLLILELVLTGKVAVFAIM